MGSSWQVGRGAIGAVALLLLLSGCAAAEDRGASTTRTLSTRDFLGVRTDQVHAAIGYFPPSTITKDFGITTYGLRDARPGRPAVLDTTRPDDERMTVAACYSDAPFPGDTTPYPRVVLGVIPLEDSTPEIVARARQRGYDDELVECPGTSETFTVVYYERAADVE